MEIKGIEGGFSITDMATKTQKRRLWKKETT